MDIDEHYQNRLWAFQAFDELQGFMDDPDFEGDPEEEHAIIERKWKELRDGKYRVVFLGAFNVGKSTLINAFLGEEYLPTVIEECTTKIIHVLRSDTMKTVLRMSSAPTESELGDLHRVLDACGLEADVVNDLETGEIIIAHHEHTSSEIHKCLRSLVTLSADEDFPQLKALRKRFDEVYIYIPNERLEEDIAFVDSPGVHSISETNRKIARDIIPNSHLVVCLLDSQSAGNEHSRGFIESIVKHRHRKMFFVINKSDQLNAEEIDPQGRRGPAKDLYRSLHGIVENPEVFFVSSLYARIAEDLRRGALTLEELDQNNKVKVPFKLQRELMNSEQPENGAAEYLMEISKFEPFKTRLLNYLYTENREGALVESACMFLSNRAWRYARPLEVKLEMARNISRLETLAQEREGLARDIEKYREHKSRVTNTFLAVARGEAEGAGIAASVDAYFSQAAVESNLVAPIRERLYDDAYYAQVKEGHFQPLEQEAQRQLARFVDDRAREIERHVAAMENQALEKARELLQGADLVDRRPLDVEVPSVGSIPAGLGATFAAFGATGVVVGGAAGAALAYVYLGETGLRSLYEGYLSVSQQSDAIAGGVACGLLGGLIGLAARAFSAKKARRARIDGYLSERIAQIIHHGAEQEDGQKAASVREMVHGLLDQRRTEFIEALENAFDQVIGKLTEQYNRVDEEERALRQQQDEIIARLAPKIEKLQAISQKAQAIADADTSAFGSGQEAPPRHFAAEAAEASERQVEGESTEPSSEAEAEAKSEQEAATGPVEGTHE